MAAVFLIFKTLMKLALTEKSCSTAPELKLLTVTDGLAGTSGADRLLP